MLGSTHADTSSTTTVTFETYADYVRHLVHNHGHQELEILIDCLSNGALTADTSRFNMKLPDENAKLCLLHFRTNHRITQQRYGQANQVQLRATLGSHDLDIQYQVIFFQLLGPDAIIPSWIVDVLGLGLDIAPDIWLYLCSRSQHMATYDINRAWVRRESFVEVGNDVLLMVKESEGKRNHTGEQLLYCFLILRRRRTKAKYSYSVCSRGQSSITKSWNTQPSWIRKTIRISSLCSSTGLPVRQGHRPSEFRH